MCRIAVTVALMVLSMMCVVGQGRRAVVVDVATGIGAYRANKSINDNWREFQDDRRRSNRERDD